MAACTGHKETLVMDVHGELSPEERIVWEQHLANCNDCRQERERLCTLIQGTKEGGVVPPLSSEEEQRLSSSMQRTLRTDKQDFRSRRFGWWLAPAFAACMVLVAAGWFGTRGTGTLNNNSGNGVDNSITANQELLENMDLLQEMESIEQLVNLLDKQNLDTTLLEGIGHANRVRTHV